MCNGTPIASDDEFACVECTVRNKDLHVDPSPLASCACAHCAVQVAGCFVSALYEPDGDSRRDAACRKIVECGWASRCAGSDCYCGDGVGGETCLTMANAGNAKGPCAGLIERVSGCAGASLPGNCVLLQQQTPNSVLARATAVALCVTGDPLFKPDLQQEAMCPLDRYGVP